ncbi:hypothetical protein OG394_39050 [Kribbella sp. NBC_01245]|uniref:esterase-like activity of phytase family protein n=1 Tax=Kribbella sp. NBC_01245 TaxID=2903578 RepID=UPI002E2D255D|nr:esterase-like activity of phytase family protein [Kribbella sp. NBC_01245]
MRRLAIAALTAATLCISNPAMAAVIAWPGASTVTVADGTNVLGGNLSGLSFQTPSVLWAVKNGPSKLYRLTPNGSTWRPDSSNGWSRGKTLRYGDGTGEPDAEGVVVTPDGMFVATERDGGGDSKPAILRYDVTSSATSLNATAEWDLTADLPEVGANDGLEAISWIPDAFLTANGFRDENTGSAYDPASYPGHGTGLYFAGLEADGVIYVYALNQSGDDFTRIATIDSGFGTVMDLEFEPPTGRLWVVCDNTCSGRTTTLALNAEGTFAATATYNRPSGMANLNNEGFAISPTCTSGRKPVTWADDGNTAGHALRTGTLPCTTS